MKKLVVYESVHKGNTLRVAERIAKTLDAKLVRASDVGNGKALLSYDLVGFGSGIYGFRHHKNLFDLIENLPNMSGRKAFIFSTSGKGEGALEAYHKHLREKLEEKGYTVIGNFACLGFVDWGPFKLMGGRNKGRPDESDLINAEKFAKGLK